MTSTIRPAGGTSFEITVTVNVDPEAWGDIYGLEETGDSLKFSVQSYVAEQVRGSAAADEGGITGVSVGRARQKRRTVTMPHL